MQGAVKAAGQGGRGRREERPSAPSVSRRRDEPGLLALGVLRLFLRRRGAIATMLVVAGATGAVAVNALTNQAGRHPAPLFGDRKAEAPRVRAAAPATNAPPAATPQATAAVAPPKPLAKSEVPTPPAPPRRDPIGELIRGDTATTASTAPKAETDLKAVQRQLAKLGYGPVKADGMMGAGTRAAIERFERDHKLPQTGEAAGRTLRELMRAGAASDSATARMPKTID